MINLQNLKPQLKDKPIAIVGLGKSGMASYEACRAAGIETVLSDDTLKSVKAAQERGAIIEDLNDADFNRFSYLCLAPGVPLTHPKPHPTVLKAIDAGCEIVSDIELFYRAQPNIKTIGVTGTNGKSTTTSLIGHILKTAGIESAIGGNLGEAVLSLPQLSKDGIYVLELSSYQLDLCPQYAPNISLLLNISPDHLDRHGNMKNYISAKEKIFKGDGIAIISIDDDGSFEVYERLNKTSKRKVIPVSCLKKVEDGIYVTEDGILFKNNKKVLDLKTCKALPGKHNWQNAAMAFAATYEEGIPVDTIIEGLKTFPGLIHRQNIVAEINGITYVNDSKATNAHSASMAIKSYPAIYWILGGKSKNSGYAPCEPYLKNIKHAFLIGAASEEISLWLKENNIPYTHSSNLETAVQDAHNKAEAENLGESTVLLSPACASFDQFKSFEARGDFFTKCVQKLLKDKETKTG